MSQLADAQRDEDLDVVQAYLAARGYSVLVELRTGDPTVTFRLEQGGRRCTILAQRETLVRENLEGWNTASARSASVSGERWAQRLPATLTRVP